MLSTDCIRYSTTEDTNALVQRAGPQLCLLVADPLNAFLHPAMQRFLFNARRRLRDAPAQPSRIFRRRLTARSPRPGRPDPKP